MSSSRRRAERETSETLDKSDTIVQPRWNTSDNKLPGFLPKLYKWLVKKDPRYRNWVEYRYVVSGRYTNAVSLNHIDRLIAKSIPKGTFAAPCMIKPDDMTPYDVDATGKPLAAATGASVVADAPARPNYSVQLEAGDHIDDTLCDDIIDCIDDEDTQDEMRTDCDGSGTELLILLEKRRTTICTDGTNNLGLDVEAIYTAHIKGAFAHATVASFNEFKSAASRLRKELVGTGYEVPDGKFALHLATAARDLGPFVGLKIDQHMLNQKARGDLTLTKKAIISALGEVEVDEAASLRLHGKSHLGWDPSRNERRGRDDDRKGEKGGKNNDRDRRASSAGPRLNHPERAWSREQDGDCKLCELLEKPAGHHWHDDCPNKKAGLAARKKAKDDEEKKDKAAEKRKLGKANKAAKEAAKEDEDDKDEQEEAPSGKGHLVQGKRCDDCEIEPDSDDVSDALFASGRTSLLDLGKIDDPEAMLKALKTQHGKGYMSRARDDDDDDDDGSIGSLEQGDDSPDYSPSEDEDDAPPPPLAPGSLEQEVPMGLPVTPTAARAPAGLISSLTPESPMSAIRSSRDAHTSPDVRGVSMRVGGTATRACV
jgi:hypothetical protein